MANGFVRAAAVSVPVHLGDCAKNRDEILKAMERLRQKGVQLAVFPELCLTGYTMGDLLLRPTVQRDAWQAMLDIARETRDMVAVVGLPVRAEGRLYNCAAVLQNGQAVGIVPKTYLPNGNEFYETRWFCPGEAAPLRPDWEGLCGQMCANLLFEAADRSFTFSVEICEDLWMPIPPSSHQALSGADIILNLSASNALAGKHDYRRTLIAQQSGRLFAGYVYAGAGYGESTGDMVFDGYTAVFENGRAVCEGPRFAMEGGMAVADIDVDRLRYHRQRSGSFHQMPREKLPLQQVDAPASAALPLMRPIDPLPFVPGGEDGQSRLEEIISIQCIGLCSRLRAIRGQNLVIGVSGGLDSTLALLVAVRSFDMLGLDRRSIHAITMPGMGTGTRTKSNADRLMEALGVNASEIAIGPAVKLHFADIGHDETVHDVTYENSQARERTQILMDYANKVNGIVLGTGDLSEAALGFCTYNGDHMSMYNPNGSVPKTLVKSLVRHFGQSFDPTVAAICQDVADTPISPELLPVTEGELNQRTEDILGDYALHDFFLYHFMDSGAGREKLTLLAKQAFDGLYDEEQITSQLTTFLNRFYTQQFKRSCAPDGPKVGSVSLSPRGDWRMPSDYVGKRE